MPLNAKEYAAQILRQGGVPEDQIPAILAKADAHLAGQEIYSRDEYNTMKGRSDAATKKVQEYDNWYAQTKPVVDGAMTEAQALKAKLAEYEAGGNPNFDASKYVSREDLEKSLGDVQGRVGTVLKVGLKLASKHAAKFGEELDVDALEKIATERGLPIDLAYQEYVRPREEAARAEQHRKEIDQKVAEAVAAERAKQPQILQQRQQESGSTWFKKDRSGAEPAALDKLDAELVRIFETGQDVTAA